MKTMSGDCAFQVCVRSVLVGLAYYDSGARSFYTKGKPIKSLADMTGLKIRVQPSKVFIDIVNALATSSA